MVAAVESDDLVHWTGRREVYQRRPHQLAHQAVAQALEPVDIDSDPQLGADFGLRIPVLARADGQSLDWPFDAEQARVFLLSPAG